MTLLISASDLTANLGQLSAEDLTRAESFIAEASDLAREIGHSTWTDAGGADPAPASVRLAVKRAVLRAFSDDADGYIQETLGDWSGRKAASTIDQVGVYFTATDEAIIRGAAGRPTGARSIRTPSAYEQRTSATLYVPVLGGSPVPWLEVYQ